MKILAIRIKNLASLEGTTEIDFTSEPLASAGIFAITGPTGAGKSTLLDALCLALYGKTPRYLQAKEMGIEIHDVHGSTMSQGDVRGILRDGTADGFAEVDFTGIDGQNYRSNWSVRRARNKAEGSMQNHEISLKNISSNLDLPGRKTETYLEIERLVGLNFEQFTRSVLLAQGDFTAFMKASKDEKSSLLEKLTGTHIYSEISKKIFEKYKNEEQVLRELNLKREGIATLTEEEVKDILEQEVTLQNQIKELNSEIDALSKEINWHEQFSQFSKNKEVALVNLNKANDALSQSEERKNKLKQVELAQSTRSWNDAMQFNEKQLTEQKANSLLLTNKAVTLKEALLKLTIQFQKDELQFSQTIVNQKEAMPKLAAAKKLDTLIFEKQKQKETAKSDKNLSIKKQELHQQQLITTEKELAVLQRTILSIQEWKDKYNDKKPIAENKDVIVSKLSDAEKLVENLNFSIVEKQNLEEKINKTNEKLKTQNLLYENFATEWEIQNKKFDYKSKEVLLVPIEKLNLENDETYRSLSSTIEAQSIWSVLHASNLDFEALRQKHANDQTTILQKEENLKQIKIVVEKNFITKEISEQILQKARLSATENVETLRSRLVDDEPCPVCGSESHPYVFHNPQLEKVLNTLEESHKQNENLYLTSFGAHSRLEQECRNLSELIHKQEEEISAKKRLVQSKTDQWNSSPNSSECENIAALEKSIWLDQKVKNLKLRQSELQVKIKAFAEEKNLLEKDKIALEKWKDSKDKSGNELKDLTSQIALLNQKLESSLKSLSQINITLTEIQNSLSIYFTTVDWLEKWKEKPGEFTTSIINFSQEWNSNSERLESAKSQQSTLIATIFQLKNQAKSFEEDVNQKSKIYTLLAEELTTKITERKGIFDGIAASLFEQQLANAVEIAQKNLELTKTGLNQNKLDLATAEALNKEVGLNISKIEIEALNNKAKIQNWLDLYNQKAQQNLSFLDLNSLLNFTSEWIEFERAALQSLTEEKTKATSVLLERTQLFDEHSTKRPSERLLEDLKIMFENSKTNIETQKQAKASIGFRLKEDEVNKNKIGDLLKQISEQGTIADNWSKLNEVIGSADGKKFRQIAQEHTLEVLLSFANQHLKDLTDRYKIERIPNTLALQVVDLDMGDEIRTVYSLSGGESFLVSLALALGLASLSSSKMKVESLFIDEGFGSLDPNTLNIAMDALERLHNLGRKVGVISHVQEMTERIPVQIKVSKKASGRSLVEVVGF